METRSGSKQKSEEEKRIRYSKMLKTRSKVVPKQRSVEETGSTSKQRSEEQKRIRCSKMLKTRSKVVSKQISDEHSDKFDQYRNGITYLLDVYEKISKNITDDHKALMQETPFKHFFKAIDEKRICGNRRKDQVLDNIITSYIPEKNAFRIGSGYCKINRIDIKLIFGIIDGELKVHNSHGKKIKSDFADRVFPNVKHITAKMMKDKLVELVENTDRIAVVDTVRVLCLLMFQSCFFTNTGQTIAWTYVKYVEDLDTLKYYDWSSVIYETLRMSLKEKSEKPRKVVGCTISLLYWLCEHATLQPREEEDPIKQQKQEDVASFAYKGIPRCTKWDLSILNKFVNKPNIMAIPQKSVILKELDPTPAEQNLIPDLIKKPVGLLMQELHDSDFEDDIPLQQRKLKPPANANASREKRLDDEGCSQYEDLQVMHETYKNAEFMDLPFEENFQSISELEEQRETDAYQTKPFERNVQDMPELETEERESIDKTIKENDEKIEHLEARVKRLKKKLKKAKAKNKEMKKSEAYVDDIDRTQKDDEIRKQKEQIRILEENVSYMEQVKNDALVKMKNFEEKKNEIKAQCFEELEQKYKDVVDVLKKEKTGLAISLGNALRKEHDLSEMVNELRSRLEEYEQMMGKNGEEGIKEMKKLSTILTGKVKHLEEENCKKESIIAELKSSVNELQLTLDVLQETNQSYESKIKEQHTTIEALHIEIKNVKEQCFDETVHAVTQQFADTDAKQKEEIVKQRSVVKRIKERKRRTTKDDDFEYPEDKKRRTGLVDLTNECEAECVKTRSKTKKVSLRSKKGAYPCGKKITKEAFQLLQTTLNEHGGLGEVWSDDNGNSITVHHMVNLLEGGFISEQVIDAFATMLSRNERVRDDFHILPAATWAFCNKYAAAGNYSNHFVNNMKGHLEQGKKILIPLCCPGLKDDPYHWILVTFASGDKGEWHMYNSMSSRKGVVDHFTENALEVQKYIWKCFGPSNLKAKKLKKLEKVPQQGPETNDCAIYVMYYMYQIARNQPIDNNWKADEVQEFKAFIVNCIASNQMNIGM